MKSKVSAPSTATPLQPRAPEPKPLHGEISFPVVAVGASAGGLEAYTDLFRALPAQTGMAFVVVQHLDPTHPSMLTELIAKVARLPVEEVKAGTTVQADRIYVIPPNAFMTLDGGTFSLTPRTKELGQHLAVNHFMRSLAASRGNRAIGVILSGTGADGSLGLESIKAEGGITFAQTPATAKYDGMPQSAIDSGCVDFVLSTKEIAKELLRLQHHPYIRQAELDAEALEANAPEAPRGDFAVILDELRRASGTDFTQYRPSTIQRRALRRMVILKLDSLADYAGYMKDHPDEGEKLYDDILIPVTSFFRDSEAFEALKKEVYPAIVKDKNNKGSIRMWAPGCSTGEETYSLAMTLLEFLGDKAASFQVQIFGTDLNEKGIQKARAGIYRESIAEEISPERLRRFFVKVADGYRVNKAVRDMCIFARQNLATDPPFSQMNLVACRNLLIYIQPVLQKKIIPVLHYALKPSGFLLMGSSESASSYPDLFSAVDKKQKIYSKKTTAYRLPYDFGQTYHPADRGPDLPNRTLKTREAVPPEFDVQAEADRIVLKSHAPVGVVVNGAMEVVQFRGRTTPYLEPAPGKPSLNLLKLARNGLALELRTLVNAAIKKDTPVRKEGITFDEGGHRQILSLSVSPIGEKGAADKRFFLVLFERTSLPAADIQKTLAARKATDTAKATQESTRLKQELADARDALHSAIESEDAFKEEFQSANEEILSANEELQSTNEELETSKEELQSANEELNTLNEELRNHNVELSQLSNDLSNLLDAIRIPIVFVGADLRIRRFTSIAAEIFRLLPADIGRSITDIKHSLDVPDLTRLIQHTVANLVSTEREVQDASGRWRSLEIRPYRTADNRIEGAIIALPDIDRLKHSEQYLKQIIDNIPTPLLVLDADLEILLANLTFCTTFKVSQANTTGQLLYRLGNEQWNIPQLKELLEDILPKKSFVQDFLVTHTFPDIGLKSMQVSAQRIEDVAGGGRPMILLAVADITEQASAHDSAKQLSETHSRLAAIIDGSDDAIISKNLDGIITSWNQAAIRIFGYPREEIIGRSILTLIPPILHHEEDEIIRRLKRGERIEHYETTRVRKDGVLMEVSLTISPIRNKANEVIGTSKIARDISGRKRMEQVVIQADKLATMGRMAATIAHEVNNPLSSVLNLIFLARTNNGSEEAASYLSTAEAEIERVSHIARQTLGYYRDLGAPVELYLRDLLEEVLKVYKSKLQTRGITVESTFDAPQPITVSKGEFVQVFSNILANAIDAMTTGGVLSLHIRNTSRLMDKGLQVIFKDQGSGIAPEHLGKVFEPFFTTKGNLGTGIGLWVARQLVEKRGGQLALTSSIVPGATGTVVTVSIPFTYNPITTVEALNSKSEVSNGSAMTSSIDHALANI
jgi:two-component system CheB/CheR fusion protein